MPEHLVTYPAGTLAKLVEEGKWKVATPPRVETQSRVEDPKVESARNLFGEDFFGEEAIHNFEEKCKLKDINVSFEIPQTVIHLNEAELESAKSEEAEGKGRMVVLRPEWMVVDGEKKPVNILTLRDLFKQETVDPNEPNKTITSYDNNPFGEEPVFWDTDWFDEEVFAQEQMKPGYGLPTKEVIPDSWNKTWDDQTALLGEGEKRREAVETVWDSLLYYAATGEKILEDKWDWTNSQTSVQRRVRVGWDSGGLLVGRWNPGDPNPDIGVCSSR